MYLFKIHVFHGLVHSRDDLTHALGHLFHRYGRLHPTCDSIDTGSQSEKVETFSLLPDSILSVDTCAIVVALLQSLHTREKRDCMHLYLFQLVLLSSLILVCLLGLSLQALRSELWAESEVLSGRNHVIQ